MTDCIFAKEEIVSSKWSKCVKQTETTGVQNLTLSSITSNTAVQVSRACSIRPACQLSVWSVWSSCRENDQLEFIQTRYRYPINWTDQDIDNCGNLFEDKKCNESETYNWQVSPWNDCAIFDKNDVRSCGEGLQRRVIYCGINNKVSHYRLDIEYELVNRY